MQWPTSYLVVILINNCQRWILPTVLFISAPGNWHQIWTPLPTTTSTTWLQLDVYGFSCAPQLNRQLSVFPTALDHIWCNFAAWCNFPMRGCGCCAFSFLFLFFLFPFSDHDKYVDHVVHTTPHSHIYLIYVNVGTPDWWWIILCMKYDF